MSNPATRRIEPLPLHALPAALENPKAHDVASLKVSLHRWGFTEPVLVDERTGRLVAGHGRVEALKALHAADASSPPQGVQVAEDGAWLVPTVRGWSSRDDTEARAYLLASNQLTIAGGWEDTDLTALLQQLVEGQDAEQVLAGTGFTEADLQQLEAEQKEQPPGVPLNDRFVVPPFSVLDARAGYWRDRKAEWMQLGLRSEEGREHLEATVVQTAWMQRGNDKGGSIFDPVLAEVLLRWYAPPGGRVFDPFAGGSVRGVVAAALGLHYLGVDLRAEQVEANRAQLFHITGQLTGGLPGTTEWVEGDATQLGKALPPEYPPADFILTCPPYGPLERYSDDPRDLSTLGDAAFATMYGQALAQAAQQLAPNRFAAVVVGSYRRKDGTVVDLRAMTVAAMEAAGLQLWQDAVLVTPVGSLALRVGSQFPSGRKMGRGHQDVLVFVKGNGKAALAALGPLATPVSVPSEPDEDGVDVDGEDAQ